jgi:preprotein translocase subunit SecE
MADGKRKPKSKKLGNMIFVVVIVIILITVGIIYIINGMAKL